jgi:hypothetical protein
MQQSVDERSASRPCASMNDHAGRLIDHDEVFIFVEQLDGNVFGFGAQGRARQNFDLDRVSGGDSMRPAACAARDAYATLINELLDTRAA